MGALEPIFLGQGWVKVGRTILNIHTLAPISHVPL